MLRVESDETMDFVNGKESEISKRCTNFHAPIELARPSVRYEFLKGTRVQRGNCFYFPRTVRLVCRFFCARNARAPPFN